MAQPRIVADFDTQISTAIAVGATSFSISSNLDDDGNTIPSGLYYFTVDNNSTNKEYFSGTLSGTSVTGVSSVTRQGVETSGAVRAHRVGASCIITDFLTYKKYIDDGLNSGATDASTTVKGIVEVATSAEVDSGATFGGTGASLSMRPDQFQASQTGLNIPSTTQKQALAGSAGTPSSSNKYITEEGLVYRNSDYDQSQTSQDSTTAVGAANTTTNRNKVAQSFIPLFKNIRGVQIYKAADTGSFTGTVTIALQADSAGSPSGSNLASVTITNAQWLLISASGTYDAVFTSEYTMSLATTYWIVISTSTSDSSNRPNLGINSTSVYANGILKYNNSTDGWVTTTTDLYFRTLEGTIAQVPKTDATTGLLQASILPYSFLDYNTADTTLANSTTLTTVYTKILPAGFIKSGTGLKIRGNWSGSDDNGAGGGTTIFITYNGTTVATIVPTALSNGTATVVTHTGVWEAMVLNTGSAAQAYIMSSIKNRNDNSTTTALSGVCTTSEGTASVDTSGIVTLQVKYQNAGATSNCNFTHKNVIIERIG